MGRRPDCRERSVAVSVGLLLAVLAWPVPQALAIDLSFGPVLDRSNWQHLELPGFEPARFKLDDRGDLSVSSTAGTSVLYQDVSSHPPSYTTLSWEWRVDKPVPVTDMTKAGGDDRDLAVHVWFPPEKSRGLIQAFGDVVKSILGFPLIGRTLTYVWGGDRPIGTRFTNPHHASDGQMIILQKGGVVSDGWRRQKINFSRDYEAIFGKPPTISPKFIAISTDSDDTGSMSRGRLRGISLSR